MKKWLIICVTVITLAALVVDTYKSFFVIESETELCENTSSKEKDGDAKKELDEKDKFFSYNSPSFNIIFVQNDYAITHSFLLPYPCTSRLEMPPELA